MIEVFDVFYFYLFLNFEIFLRGNKKFIDHKFYSAFIEQRIKKYFF